MWITAARREDCEAIAHIHVDSWRAAYAGLFSTDYLASLSVADRTESWLSIVTNSASRTLVAKMSDGEILGYVSFGHCRDQGCDARRGEIWALYVAPRHWSAGGGWALWEAARVHLLHRGFDAVSLWVLEGNARGIRFYESIGFRHEAGSRQYFERGGTKLAEVRLVFDGMSASPAIERADRGFAGPGAGLTAAKAPSTPGCTLRP